MSNNYAYMEDLLLLEEFHKFYKKAQRQELTHTEHSQLMQLTCVMATRDAITHPKPGFELLSQYEREWLKNEHNIYLG